MSGRKFPIPQALLGPQFGRRKSSPEHFSPIRHKGGSPKPHKFVKSYQCQSGTPRVIAAFLECLCEAYRVYTPIDLDAPENQTALTLALVIQSTPDKRKKLQKLKGFQDMNWSQLIEVAQKVFNNRDSPGELQEKRLGKIECRL